MLITEDLKFKYPKGGEFHFPDIALPPGEQLLILGDSGVGKTTWMHLLTGLLPPSGGHITVDGTELTTLSRKKLDKFRGTHMGIVFQKGVFISSLTVQENLQIRLRFPRKLPDNKRIFELCSRLGLGDQLHKKIQFLSEGQRQRLSIALGVIHNPKIVFADEPTSNLDDRNCQAVLDLLKEEVEMVGARLIMITHDRRVKEMFSNHINL